MALAFALYHLSSLGLADNNDLLEILVEVPGTVNADINTKILMLTRC